MTEQLIKEHLNNALKEGNKTKVSVLRMVISEIGNKKIACGVKELEENSIIALLQKLAKQHQESIEKFKQGGRDDLVAKETGELQVLEDYLPEPLSEAELAEIVAGVVSDTGASSMKDMGNVMKKVQEVVAGRADGKIISRMVKEKLA